MPAPRFHKDPETPGMNAAEAALVAAHQLLWRLAGETDEEIETRAKLLLALEGAQAEMKRFRSLVLERCRPRKGD